MYGVRTDGTQGRMDEIYPGKTSQRMDTRLGSGYKSNYRKFYDVYCTPVVYLLDEHKKILAKRLGVTQLDEFLQRALSGSNL